MEIKGKFGGKTWSIDGQGTVHDECYQTFKMKIAPKCLQYREPVMERVHSECNYQWECDNGIQCLHCIGPIVEVKGRFCGRYFELAGQGRVHSECYNLYKVDTAPKCFHCRGPVTKIPNKYSGVYYTEKEGKIHEECHIWKRATSPKCAHCKEPLMEIKGRFGGTTWTLDGNFTVHDECLRDYRHKTSSTAGNLFARPLVASPAPTSLWREPASFTRSAWQPGRDHKASAKNIGK